MFLTRSANWSLVIACVMGLATNDAVFAYGGPGSGYGSGDPAFGSGYPSYNRPLDANSNSSGQVPLFAPARFSHAASPLVDGGEIVLFSPAGTLREAQYSLNGVPYVMKPGTMQRLKNDRIWNVELNSGTGQVMRYTLAPGAYKFRPSGLLMSMGLVATQDRPETSAVALANATAASGLPATSTGAPEAIVAPPTPMFDHPKKEYYEHAEIEHAKRMYYEHPEIKLIPRKLLRRFDEHPGPAITASQWFNTGNGVSLGQFRDKVILLDFWGNWCGPCVRNLPKVQALYEKYKDRGLVVIGVHSPQGAESAAAFLARNSYSFPIAIDTGATADRYGVEGWPSYFLIDKSGTQTLRFGHEPPHEQQIENLLQR